MKASFFIQCNLWRIKKSMTIFVFLFWSKFSIFAKTSFMDFRKNVVFYKFFWKNHIHTQPQKKLKIIKIDEEKISLLPPGFLQNGQSGIPWREMTTLAIVWTSTNPGMVYAPRCKGGGAPRGPPRSYSPKHFCKVTDPYVECSQI